MKSTKERLLFPIDLADHSTKNSQKHFSATILIDQHHQRFFYCFTSKYIKISMVGL